MIGELLALQRENEALTARVQELEAALQVIQAYQESVSAKFAIPNNYFSVVPAALGNLPETPDSSNYKPTTKNDGPTIKSSSDHGEKS